MYGIGTLSAVYMYSHKDERKASIRTCSTTRAVFPIHSTSNGLLGGILYPAPSLFPLVHGKLFPRPTGWRMIAETLTMLPHWLKLTQSHSVSIASLSAASLFKLWKCAYSSF